MVWVRHIGPSSNATAAATTTSSEHRSSSIPGMSWKIPANIITNMIATHHGRSMWMRMGFKLMVLLLNSQLQGHLHLQLKSSTKSHLKNKKNDITKSCYTSHQLTTSWTTSLSSMSMASSSSGPKRFSSRIQVTVSSCRARVSSIRTTSSPADVNQQLVFRNLLPRWEKMTKLTCSFVFYIFWESI